MSSTSLSIMLHNSTICRLCNNQYKLPFQRHGQGSAKKVNSLLPIILPCGHTFCERCIKNKLLQEGNEEEGIDSRKERVDCKEEGMDSKNVMISYVICPVKACQRRSCLKGDEVSMLPYNRYLIGCLVSLDPIYVPKRQTPSSNHSAERQNTERAEVCANCQSNAGSVICAKCGDVCLCQNCFKVIHQFPLWRHHEAVPIDKEYRGSSQPERFKLTNRCSSHSSRQIEFYCGDCKTGCCADCLFVGSHTGHSLKRLEEANVNWRSELESTQQKLATALALAQESKRVLQSQKGARISSEHPSLSRIEEFYQRIYALLQLKQCEQKKLISTSTCTDPDQLVQFENAINSNIEHFERFLEVLDRILKEGESMKMYDFSAISVSANDLLTLPCHFLSKDTECPIINVNMGSEHEITQLLSKAVAVDVNRLDQSRLSLVRLDEVPDEILNSFRQPQRSTPELCEGESQSSLDVSRASHSSHGNHGNPVNHSLSRQLSQSSISSPYSADVSYKTESVYESTPTRFYTDDDESYKEASDQKYENVTNDDYGSLFNSGYSSSLSFENCEMAARVNAQQVYHQISQQATYNKPIPRDIKYRDMRLLDHSVGEVAQISRNANRMPYGQYDVNFMQRQHVDSGPTRAAGRGRARPAPVFAPGSISTYNTQSAFKPLYMKPPLPISDCVMNANISYIVSPNEIYIQQPSQLKLLKRLEQKILSHCQSVVPVTDLQHVKYLFGFKDGGWRRCEMRRIYDRSAQVFFPDYGYTETIKFYDLRYAVPYLLGLPSVAVKCYLQGIQPADGGDEWPPDAAEHMNDVLQRNKFVTLMRLDIAPTCELEGSVPIDLVLKDANCTCELSMRDYLVFTECAVWDSPSSPFKADEHMMKQGYMSKTPIKEGERLQVAITHAVNPSEMFAQVVRRDLDDEWNVKVRQDPEFEKLSQIFKAMQERYNYGWSKETNRVLIPKPGLPVAASYMGEWYRAQIISLLPGRVKVTYADFGNEEIVKPTDLRVLFKEFSDLPAQAVKFSVYGIGPMKEEWSKKIGKGIMELCVDRATVAKAANSSLSEKGLQLHLTMYDTKENFADLLVQTGLAQRTCATVTLDEGFEGVCTYVESPAELYIRALSSEEQLQSLTSELNKLMEERGVMEDSCEWRINDECVVKQGLNWVRCVILAFLPDGSCKLRMSDYGKVIKQTVKNLRPCKGTGSCPPLAVVCYISGITPTGGSAEWSMTAKELIQEILCDKDSIRIVPTGHAIEKMPCDILYGEEQPSHVSGQQGEIKYFSVKEKMLEEGVALRKKIPGGKPHKGSLAKALPEKSSNQPLKPAPVDPKLSPKRQDVTSHDTMSGSILQNPDILDQSQTVLKNPERSNLPVCDDSGRSNQQLNPQDQTTNLLLAAATKLWVGSERSASNPDMHKNSSELDEPIEDCSSSDPPTPELFSQLAKATNIPVDGEISD